MELSESSGLLVYYSSTVFFMLIRAQPYICLGIVWSIPQGIACNFSGRARLPAPTGVPRPARIFGRTESRIECHTGPAQGGARERNRLNPQPHLTYFSPPESSRDFTPHPHTTMTHVHAPVPVAAVTALLVCLVWQLAF